MKKILLIFIIIIEIVFVAGCNGGEILTDTKTSTDFLAHQILEKADSYKILFDSDAKLLDSSTMSGCEYYVVSFSNIIPYASGIEVIYPDGKKMNSQSDVEPLFISIAWKEASSQLKPSDIQTMRNILQTSKDIESEVAPVIQVTDSTLDSLNSLKSACIDVPLLGIKCAWDAVTTFSPGIGMLANELNNLNNDLNQWKNAASSIAVHLPNAINGIDHAKDGGKIDPQLQSEISQSLSAFGTLQSKTSQISGELSTIRTSLATVESGLRKAVGIPYVGSLISPVADSVGNTRIQIETLKGKTDSFSRSINEQNSKLSSISETANKKTYELSGQWSSRQSAETKVYATIFVLIVVLILGIAILFYYKRKRNHADPSHY
jgi:hypothetical protein